MKPKLNRLRPPHIPLYWEKPNGHGKVHIGYYYPVLGLIGTTKGNISVLNRLNANGKMTEPKNKMHLRRQEAALKTEDFTYRGE